MTRAISARDFYMFKFLQSLSSHCRPGKATVLITEIIGSNKNELWPKARFNCFPETGWPR